jgi:hypothetical protein
MKKLIIFALLAFTLSCSKGDDGDSGGNPNPSGGGSGDCGSTNGYTLHKDNQGCYYSDSYGYKVYVDASLCTCE